ncbi:MAG: hypothetical protein DCF20_08615 [Pseudanabaena sp.]|nr:MAG: hypothetical protein DCF20_08615 [Pseudanabaena sp.]
MDLIVSEFIKYSFQTLKNIKLITYPENQQYFAINFLLSLKAYLLKKLFCDDDSFKGFMTEIIFLLISIIQSNLKSNIYFCCSRKY